MLLRIVSNPFFVRSIARRFGRRPPDLNHGTEIKGSKVHRETSDYSPPLAQVALWDAAIGSFLNLKKYDSHEDSILFHGAQPSHYVRHYRLRPWQWLLYPFHCASFSRRMRLLTGMPVDAKESQELIRLLDEDLAYIEFAGKQLFPQLRYRARKEMLRERISPWRVRSVFISTSIRSHAGHIAARRISGSVYWPLRIAREVLLAMAVWSSGIATWEIAMQSCLTCNALGLLYSAVFMTLVGYLAHIGGPERRRAEHFLTRMQLLEFEIR